MPKFYTEIGFTEGTEETSHGVWTEKITKRNYYGEVVKNFRKLWESTNINDDFVVDNTLSILSDTYACENVHAMRYILWNGVLWKIASAEINYPRITLTLGGIYHGGQTT